MTPSHVIQQLVKAGGITDTLTAPFRAARDNTGIFEDLGYSLGQTARGFSGSSVETPGLSNSDAKLIEALQLKEESLAVGKEIDRLRIRIRALRAQKERQKENQRAHRGRYI